VSGLRAPTLPPATTIALMVTRRCNMRCGHCSVESGPEVRGEPSEAELLDRVRQAAAADVRSINLTGGEPMLRPRTVLRLVRAARRLGMAPSLTTNGSWGRTEARARRGVRALRRAGLASMAVSVDRYHDEFQGPAPAALIARAAEDVGLPVRIHLVVPAKEDALARLVAPFEGLRSARLRFYGLQAVGRARGLPAEAMEGEVEGFCAACAAPAVTDDGRVTACNGPAYFAADESPLVVGSLRTESLATIVARHRSDPILDTIRTQGPARLRDELRTIPGFERFPFRARYLGICDLCLHVTSDAGAVDALRRRLAQPQLAAERRAAWVVIQDSRRRGTLNAARINESGAGHVFLQAVTEPAARWSHDADRILSRPDVDWRHWAWYLAACGLARPLVPVLDDPVLGRRAPTFFAEAVRASALREGMLGLVQQETLRQVDRGLQSVGARGVLLKGMALRELVAQRGPSYPLSPRGTGDIDVYVDPGDAERLRARLIEQGFRGAPGARPTSPHHLAGVSLQGVLVEIHTRIAAPFWGLPEADMLARARRVGRDHGLHALDGEGLLLHAMVHCAQNCFSHGLRAAWDVLAVLRMEPDLDWDRLAGWVEAMRVPRAFWVPLAVLTRELGLPVPAGLLDRAPRDRLQRKLETVAERRLFRAAEHPGELDPLSRNGLLLMLHGSARARLRYLGALARWATVRPRAPRGPAAGRSSATGALQQAWRHLGQYRRAAARGLALDD
jgi:hypothetical protein